MHVSALPIRATSRNPEPRRHPLRGTRDRPVILITGAAGVIATILARALSGDHDLIGVDVVPSAEPKQFSEYHVLSVADRNAMLPLASQADYIIHLATGAPAGWHGLIDAEINGTRNLIDGAISGDCRRLIIGSSNHVVGWHELDYLAGRDDAVVPLPVDSPPRPDGLYACAKTFSEALGRAAAEWAGLPVSILRIGTVRAIDDPLRYLDEPGLSYIGKPEDVLHRLRLTWLSHPDLIRICRDEFAHPDTFRLRFAISAEDSPLWGIDALAWQAPAAHPEISFSKADR